MSRESERVAIVDYFLDNWDMVAYPTKMPNQSFTEPQGRVFCHLMLIKLDEQRLTLGKTNYRVRSISEVQFDIYGPPDKGERTHALVEDAFATLFRDKVLTTTDGQKITFKQPKGVTFGPKGNQYRISIRALFWRDFYTSVSD